MYQVMENTTNVPSQLAQVCMLTKTMNKNSVDIDVVLLGDVFNL